MPPKWIYYAAANFGLVTTGLLAPLWGYGPRLPWPVNALVFIVSLIGGNLLIWYSLRLRARAALATDQTSANHKPKISRRTRTLQFVLIGSGLLLLAITVFGSLDRITRIGYVVGGLVNIAYGTVFRLKIKTGPK